MPYCVGEKVVYLLDMTKSRWEIVPYSGKVLCLRPEFIRELSLKEEAIQYNNNYWLGTNKQNLWKVAENIRQINIDTLTKELEYYTNMKIKVCRK